MYSADEESIEDESTDDTTRLALEHRETCLAKYDARPRHRMPFRAHV